MNRFKVLFLGVCLAAPAFAADYLPLRSGNTWTYRDARFGQTLTIRVGTPSVIEGRTYYTLTGYVPKPILVRLNDANDLVALDEVNRVERVVASFTSKEGALWDAPFRECTQQGETLQDRGLHDGPTGPFSGVLELSFRVFFCADTGVESEQYAANIGMVRRVMNSFAGPVQFDLIYARIGNIVIDASPNASFSVSAEQTPGSSFVTATLRLFTNSADELGLPFPTAQEYDVELLDKNDRVLWTWSAGRVFAQAAHLRVVSGQWTAAVQIPIRDIPNAAASCCHFTVHAWLTTSGSAPRFAAAAPIELNGPNGTRLHRSPRGSSPASGSPTRSAAAQVSGAARRSR